jgi:transcriptional regulator with XRE-family HTH domain
MKISEMVEHMRTTKRRELAGRIVQAEYARQRMTREQAAENMKMSPSTLDRIRDGDDRITGPKLRSVEGVLHMPDYLLTYIIEGDIASIDAIGESEMRPGMRRVILNGLAQISAEEVENHGNNNTHSQAR